MKKIITIIVLLVLLVILVLVMSIAKKPIHDSSALPSGEETTATLTGETWVWAETIMNDDEYITPNKPGVFTLVFNEAEGSVTGTTDCNNFRGNYAAEGDTIAFSDFASTLMFCEGSQEAEFVQMVSAANSYMITQEGKLALLLPFDSGSVIFEKK